MSDEPVSRVLAGIRAQPYRGRSDLYRWLRANHRRLARRIESDEASWSVVAREIAAVGVRNRKGEPPSSDSVRRVWATVCRDVAQTAAEKASAGKRKHPSHISPDWRPQVVPPAQPGPSVAVRPTSPPAPFANPHPTIEPAGSQRPVPAEAPMEFSTVDADGNPLPEGKVFYRGEVRSRHVAEQLETFRRYARGEDYFR